MPSGIYKRTEKHIEESISHLPKNPQYWKGKKFSEEHKKKLIDNHSGMKGKHHTKIAKLKIAKGHAGIPKPMIRGEKHYAWKGDKVKYAGLHRWVYLHLGKASMCENKNCVYPRKNRAGIILQKAKTFQWANKSHNYKRELSDWIQLCASCHAKYDKKIITISI